MAFHLSKKTFFTSVMIMLCALIIWLSFGELIIDDMHYEFKIPETVLHMLGHGLGQILVLILTTGVYFFLRAYKEKSGCLYLPVLIATFVLLVSSIAGLIPSKDGKYWFTASDLSLAERFFPSGSRQNSDIIQKVASLCLNSGGAIPEAAQYTPGLGLHPIVFLNERGTEYWNFRNIPRLWKPKSILEVQLIACIEDKSSTLGNCPYDGGVRIPKVVKSVNIRIYGAKTANPIFQKESTGSIPPCPDFISSGPGKQIPSEISGEDPPDVFVTLKPLIET